VSDIESDHLPQHDPPEDAELVQPEVDERHDSIVVSGDDEDHVLPPTELDPYTPELGPRIGQARQFTAMVLGISGVLVFFAIIFVIALLR
jgi:hypothetical protein